MHRRIAAPVAAVLLLLAGCGDGHTLGDVVRAAATWSGTAQTSSTPVTVTMELAEGRDGAVTGTAEILIGQNTISGLAVTDTRESADMELTLTLAPFDPVVFTGEFQGRTEILREFNGSGFTGDTITFTRQ